MSDQREGSERSQTFSILLFAIMALLMYVLSVGPVAGYYSRVYYGATELPPSFYFVAAFYYPLECLSETPLGAPLEFYVGLWRKE